MEAAECFAGSAVTVAAADDFYKFIDGWRGIVRGWTTTGHVIIDCLNPDGLPVEFYVPPEQLQKATP